MQRRLVIRVCVILVVALFIWLRGPDGDQNRQNNLPADPVAPTSQTDASETALPAESPTLEIRDVTDSADTPPSQRNTAGGEPAERDSAAETPDSPLRALGNDRFESPAGLVYGPGSRDRHRLTHVMKHRSDDPQKIIHGVFDGSESEVLELIDEAYELARQGGNRSRGDPQNNRMVYTVDLQRRVGFVGGQRGQEDNHPECRFVRLVLENDRDVVTAYPVTSF